ncbi:MAG TPA: response regulator transcription factor [Anaerolineae bacterium]|nr:response regulator transcription factor [Anaerolineae bacterium]
MVSTQEIRVILAEDHHIVRAAVAVFLAKEADIEIVGEAADTGTLLEMMETLRPDVLVLDAHIPGQKVIETAQILRERYPELRILVLSAYDRKEYVLGLLRAGASGYMMKDDPPDQLPQAIRAVAQGEEWLSPRIIRLLTHSADGLGKTAFSELTDREIDVLRLIAQGYRNDQIAAELYISEFTVKNHTRSIFSKLNVKTRVEAALYALNHGLIPPSDR